MNQLAVLILALAVAACGDDGDATPPVIDAATRPVDATTTRDAPVGTADAPAGACPVEEIMFTQATGCQNDGSVELCIPANDAAVLAELEAIEPAITCAEGGGRARCLQTPGLLLCTYPTEAPAQCVADNGAMTDDTWKDMCAIAALPGVDAIVHTIFE